MGHVDEAESAETDQSEEDQHAVTPQARCLARFTASKSDAQGARDHFPLTFKKRSGRKLVVTPDGAEWAPGLRVDNAMVKVLARAFRWRKMLDTGVHATIEDLARARGVNPTYVSRILRLPLLAPHVVEAILDGRQPADMQLDDLMQGFSTGWEWQRSDFG